MRIWLPMSLLCEVLVYGSLFMNVGWMGGWFLGFLWVVVVQVSWFLRILI